MDKEKLLEYINQSLQWNNLKIDLTELDEIIEIYDHYLDLLLEATSAPRNSYHDRYAFIDVLKNNSSCSDWDLDYYNIFLNITYIKKFNLLGCLDYIRLINSLRGPIYNIVRTLLNVTNSVLGYPYRNKRNLDTTNNRINYYYNYNERLITVWFDLVLMDTICESSYISDGYKESIKLYSELKILSRQFNSSDDYKTLFEHLINISYYYFIANNYFNTECDDVIRFLKYMYNNPIDLLDKMHMAGIIKRNELLDYFDYLYKTSKNTSKKAIK